MASRLMETLCVRVAGPLVSWGSGSLFRVRHTAPTPTLSAVQGLLAAAAGVPRGGAWPKWLSELSLVLRIDRPGTVVRDFHTVSPVDGSRYWALSDKDREKLVVIRRESGSASRNPYVTSRYYIADSATVAFIKDPAGEIEAALSEPLWALYAGRKSCPLSEPVVLGRAGGAPSTAAAATPTAAGSSDGSAPMRQLDVVAFTTADVPAGVAVQREKRPDRLTPGGGHSVQERHMFRVEVPCMSSWFDVLPGRIPTL